jgi:hypothetical protein
MAILRAMRCIPDLAELLRRLFIAGNKNEMKSTHDIVARGSAVGRAGHSPEQLPLDLETAPELPARPLGYRAYVGGVLYVEGLVVLLMGLTLLASYWPPVSAFGKPANPVSKVGLWMAGSALVYMVVVGLGIFCYNLWKPGGRHAGTAAAEERSMVLRARRYASMKKRTRYIFDNTICCERDAEEALLARDLY